MMVYFIVIFLVSMLFWMLFGSLIFKETRMFNSIPKMMISSFLASILSTIVIQFILSIIVYYTYGVKYECTESYPVIGVELNEDVTSNSFYLWKESNKIDLYFIYKDGKQYKKSSIESDKINVIPNKPGKMKLYEACVNNKFWKDKTWTFSSDFETIEIPNDRVEINFELGDSR